MAMTRTRTKRATLISPVRATGRPPFGVSPVTAATAVMSAAAMSHVYQVIRAADVQDYGHIGCVRLLIGNC